MDRFVAKSSEWPKLRYRDRCGAALLFASRFQQTCSIPCAARGFDSIIPAFALTTMTSTAGFTRAAEHAEKSRLAEAARRAALFAFGHGGRTKFHRVHGRSAGHKE